MQYISYTAQEYQKLGIKPEDLTEAQLKRQERVPIEIMRIPSEDLFGTKSNSQLALRIQKEYPAVYRQKKLEAISKGLIVDRNLTAHVERMNHK